MVAGLFAIGLAALVMPALAQPIAIGCALIAVFYIWLNRAFFSFLSRRLGFFRSLSAMAMHFCYHIYAPLAYVLVVVQTRMGLRRAA